MLSRYEVAVIIPRYDAAPYLARALDSAFAQTYRDYCVFVIDDGSNDDIATVLRSYAGRVVTLKRSRGWNNEGREYALLQPYSVPLKCLPWGGFVLRPEKDTSFYWSLFRNQDRDFL